MTNGLFDCDYCEGNVVKTTGPGRSYDFRTGIVLEIPEDFATATCQSCGKSYLTSEEATRLERHFETRLAAECRNLVEIVQTHTGLSQKQVELAAGVTPTYLSHVFGGRKQPSSTLFGLLECLARHPEEARRRVEGQHWKSPCPAVMEWTVEVVPEQAIPTVHVAPANTSERPYLKLVIPAANPKDTQGKVPKVPATKCEAEEVSCQVG